MGAAQLQGFGPAEACIPSETAVTEYILLAVRIGAELRQLRWYTQASLELIVAS